MFKLVQTCSNLLKLAQICSNLLKLVQTCFNFLLGAQTCSNLFKLAQNCSYLFKLVWTCSILLKLCSRNWTCHLRVANQGFFLNYPDGFLLNVRGGKKREPHHRKNGVKKLILFWIATKSSLQIRLHDICFFGKALVVNNVGFSNSISRF